MSWMQQTTLKPLHNRCPLETFVACAQQMLEPATPESVRRSMEPQLLEQLPTLRALGVFDLFEIRDPSLRAWLAKPVRQKDGYIVFVFVAKSANPMSDDDGVTKRPLYAEPKLPPPHGHLDWRLS